MQKVHKLYYNNDDDDPGLEQVRQGYPIDESASRSEGTAPDHVANAAAGLSTRGISAPSGGPVAEDFKVAELGFVDKKDTHQRILMSKALPLNEPMGPLLLENESALEKSDEIELEENESSFVFDANISEDNASNETIDAVRARTIGLSETASDDESVDNSSELNASITDKSAKQSVSGNDSLALNFSEGPLLLENESALEKSDEIELEENESSFVFDANISEDNASNETIDAVRARTIGLNETASDDESVDNSSELNASITDKSAKQSVSGNSLALNVSEGPLLLENESALEKSDEIELEENESSFVFDANISEDNASNETIDAVRARTIGLNETASDDESVDNSSELNASITDKSAKQSVSGNSLALNVSEGPLLLENESALEKSDEIELEENESSFVFDANISEDNASNETIDAVRARTIGLNETASDDESVDNSSELNASITDKSAKQSVSGNSLALNVSEGPLLLENESALEKSDEIELEENESSFVFDANISEDNASNETIDAVRARTIGLNETVSDDESVDNSSELNASITDKSAKQSVSGNDSLALNVSEGPLLLENESASEKSDEIELEENESSLVFDANISEDNASNETVDAVGASTIGLNETANDAGSVDNSSELNASVADKSDNSSLWEMLDEHENQSVSANGSLALNVSEGPLLLENESAPEKSDEIELEENESSLVFDANISEDNASNETFDAVGAGTIGLNETANDAESVDNSLELNASVADKSDNSSLWEMLDENENQSVSANGSLALNVSEGPLLLENESASEKSDETELEENESSLVFDANISEDNASNETVDAVGASTIGLNETANDAESVDNSSELNASVADKSDNSSLWEMLDENENQSVSANGSLALNVSEGPLLLENESASEKSDETELEENESSLVFDANISEDHASNETVDAVGAGTIGLNAESVDNSSELNASVADKSDNSSLWEMLDENENQSVSANGSLALNVSEGPLLLENDSASEKSDGIELEENESSSLVFDANISEDNASNETVDAVGAGTISLNETANDAESVDNSSDLNASVADKSDNSSLWEMLDENENQSVSANGSLALNVSEGPLLLENESASEKSDETELEENESSLVFDANVSEDNASNETVDAVGAGTIGLNETANDAGSVDNSSELNASVADKSDNSSLWEMLDENENQSVSANGSLALNVSEGPLLLENESAPEKSDEIELEENESSSLVFDANISEDNASNETVDAVGAGTIGLNETANDAESVDNSSELNASVADKSDSSSLWEMLDENENQSVSANGSLALNVSEGPLLLENESASEKSDEIELEENESSSIVSDANISEDNASNETVDAVGAGTIGLNETANDAKSVDNSSELNASVADKSDSSSLWEMLDENENQSVSANGSLALNVSEGPLLLENESASEKSDEIELEENESSSLAFDANISEDNASNETVDAVGAGTIGLNETANDAESVDNSLELNASVADKSDNSSLWEMLDENENQSVSANGSLALNVSEGPLLLENESASEKSDGIELEENESSSIVSDANISEDNASNETVDAVGAGTIGLNETANDAESVDNSLELNASVADKSDNSSLWEMLNENENQSVSANGSLALNVSEGPLLLENESASEKSDETELEENESSLVFDANISEDNASNETQARLLGNLSMGYGLGL